MPSRVLADDSGGAWRITFKPEERHLFLYYSHGEHLPDPAHWISIDDFLAWLPRDETHRRTIERLVELIEEAFEQARC